MAVLHYSGPPSTLLSTLLICSVCPALFRLDCDHDSFPSPATVLLLLFSSPLLFRASVPLPISMLLFAFPFLHEFPKVDFLLCV